MEIPKRSNLLFFVLLVVVFVLSVVFLTGSSAFYSKETRAEELNNEEFSEEFFDWLLQNDEKFAEDYFDYLIYRYELPEGFSLPNIFFGAGNSRVVFAQLKKSPEIEEIEFRQAWEKWVKYFYKRMKAKYPGLYNLEKNRHNIWHDDLSGKEKFIWKKGFETPSLLSIKEKKVFNRLKKSHKFQVLMHQVVDPFTAEVVIVVNKKGERVRKMVAYIDDSWPIELNREYKAAYKRLRSGYITAFREGLKINDKKYRATHPEYVERNRQAVLMRRTLQSRINILEGAIVQNHPQRDLLRAALDEVDKLPKAITGATTKLNLYKISVLEEAIRKVHPSIVNPKSPFKFITSGRSIILNCATFIVFLIGGDILFASTDGTPVFQGEKERGEVDNNDFLNLSPEQQRKVKDFLRYNSLLNKELRTTEEEVELEELKKKYETDIFRRR